MSLSMSAAFRGVSSASDTTFGVSSLAVNTPAGVADGDGLITMIIGAVLAPTAAPTFTPPSGWTEIKSDTFTSAGGAVNNRGSIYRRVASSEPANNTWTTSVNAAILIAAYAAQSSNIVGLPDATPTFNSGTGTAVAATGYTTIQSGVLLLQIAAITGGATYTAAAGMSERLDTAGLFVSDVLQAAIGASGTKTATASASGDWVSWLIGLRSAPQVGALLSATRNRLVQVA